MKSIVVCAVFAAAVLGVTGGASGDWIDSDTFVFFSVAQTGMDVPNSHPPTGNEMGFEVLVMEEDDADWDGPGPAFPGGALPSQELLSPAPLPGAAAMGSTLLGVMAMGRRSRRR